VSAAYCTRNLEGSPKLPEITLLSAKIVNQNNGIIVAIGKVELDDYATAVTAVL
jgi:hypothetical protein